MRKRVAEEAAASLVAKQREVHWAAAGQGVEGYALGPGFLLEEMTADRRRGLTCFTRGRSDVPSDLRIWAGLHHRPHQIYTIITDCGRNLVDGGERRYCAICASVDAYFPGCPSRGVCDHDHGERQ